MKSFEILRETIKDVGAKSIASDMKLSTSLVYKWCESTEGGGAENPLDRVLQICELTGSAEPVDWLCRQTNSFRVKNPVDAGESIVPVLRSTQGILKEFTELLQAVSKSYDNDGVIDEKEAQKIRREWEDLKCLAESFVYACEQGTYGESNQ